jgi:hypothetical protein
VSVYGIVQNVTGDHLLFGLSFRGARGRALHDLEEFVSLRATRISCGCISTFVMSQHMPCCVDARGRPT